MAAHPYYPLTLELPGYHPPLLPFEQTLAYFFGGCAVVFAVVFIAIGQLPYLHGEEKLLACWFVVTGLIHFVVEGYVVVFANFYKDTSANILSEIWKEYAKADSRYATRDPFVISMEGVTAFAEGPCCFLIVFGLLTRQAWRYWLIVMVSVGQIYGDVLYYVTCLLDGAPHVRPEWLYYWFYFVAVNGIWIVVPSLCIYYATLRISAATTAHDKQKQS